MRAKSRSCSILFWGTILSPPLHPSPGRCWHCILTLSSVKPQRTDPHTMYSILNPTEKSLRAPRSNSFNLPGQGLCRKAGAAHPQLGLRATVPNAGNKGRSEAEERPFPALGTLNKPREAVLLSAPQVSRGLIYSPAHQVEEFPARVLDQLPPFAPGRRDTTIPQKPCLSFQTPSESDHRVVFSPLTLVLKSFKSFLYLRTNFQVCQVVSSAQSLETSYI